MVRSRRVSGVGPRAGTAGSGCCRRGTLRGELGCWRRRLRDRRVRPRHRLNVNVRRGACFRRTREVLTDYARSDHRAHCRRATFLADGNAPSMSPRTSALRATYAVSQRPLSLAADRSSRRTCRAAKGRIGRFADAANESPVLAHSGHSGMRQPPSGPSPYRTPVSMLLSSTLTVTGKPPHEGALAGKIRPPRADPSNNNASFARARQPRYWCCPRPRAFPGSNSAEEEDLSPSHSVDQGGRARAQGALESADASSRDRQEDGTYREGAAAKVGILALVSAITALSLRFLDRTSRVIAD